MVGLAVDHTQLTAVADDSRGGRAGRAELLSGIEGVSSRPVRKIVLREE